MQPLARSHQTVSHVLKVTTKSILAPQRRTFSSDKFKQSVSQMFGDTKAQNLEQYLEMEQQKEKMEKTLVFGTKL